jgi:hypothetical protein
MSTIRRIVPILIIFTLLCAACSPASTPTAQTVNTTSIDPYGLVSLDSLVGYLTGLTSIQPYSGWRNSGSSGEAEALDYVEQELDEFTYLQAQGLEIERQQFDVFLSLEIWSTNLVLGMGGKEIEVPANGLRGSRLDRQMAAYFDSDGILGDSDPNPMSAEGSPLLIYDQDTLYSLFPGQASGRILIVNYSLFDTAVNIGAVENTYQLSAVIDGGAAGLVFITNYSNANGKSRGSFVGDGAVFRGGIPSRRIPILYARIEDMADAGITTWEDLQAVETVDMTLDSDIFSPGQGGNVIARIPGADPSRAVILGAHIDSPNGPAAFDNGSGSAALLEVARVLDASQVQPPVDVYLAWFGGHEIGTYGSAYFASTHQELLDRTLADIQMDGLGYPLDGQTLNITMTSNNYMRFGEQSQVLMDSISQAAAARGIAVDQMVEYPIISDNGNFDAFNVPNVYLGYTSISNLTTASSDFLHYASHWHDPYETVDLIPDVGEVYVEMTKVMLTVALEIGKSSTDTRITPAAEHRAVFVASHTESVSMVTAQLRDLGMALAWEGFDVDLIPCGQEITAADLNKADLVLLMPTMDYPRQTEEWSQDELALLEKYVKDGGFLVVTNSISNYISSRPTDDLNEDTRALNSLLEPMGVHFKMGVPVYEISSDIVTPAAEHPLTKNAEYLSFYNGNNVPFTMESGTVLFRTATSPIVGLVDYGKKGGQLLIIADPGLLQLDRNGVKNLELLQNIASYAGSR